MLWRPVVCLQILSQHARQQRHCRTPLRSLSNVPSRAIRCARTGRWASFAVDRNFATADMPSNASDFATVDPVLLAKAWYPDVRGDSQSTHGQTTYVKAVTRCIQLLEDSSSIPFICRYRTDQIHPLTTQQVQTVYKLKTNHESLGTMRHKLFVALQQEDGSPVTKKTRLSPKNAKLWQQIQTSTSKAQLDDFYKPYKPPSKGSILERIRADHPDLVDKVDRWWDDSNASHDWSKLKPRESVVNLIGIKIAHEPQISAVVFDETMKHCKVSTKIDSASTAPQINTYKHYDDFTTPLKWIKPHEILAIRRGVDQKVLKLSYVIDADKMESTMRYHLRQADGAPKSLVRCNTLLAEGIHDAWTRLLRRQATSRAWKERCKEAEERAIEVFANNLHHALLAPPLSPPRAVVALDPGFKAGIKCAILDAVGKVHRLETIQFVGSASRKHAAVKKIESMIAMTTELVAKDIASGSDLVVAVGNGHGSQECQELVDAAMQNGASSIPVHVVDESGASVWSITQEAQSDFPEHQPASIASVSIGRRLQNPLQELVKVPPKSLGLGMYQHDLTEKKLEEQLDMVSVDAVATVGVDVNTCSLQILQKVPGLNRLAKKIVTARPLRRRQDLLEVSGLGPKTFENCAGFCHVDGDEPLDMTPVHPESYMLARWLLKREQWELQSNNDYQRDLPPRNQWRSHFQPRMERAAEKFGVSKDRVFVVIEQLLDSMSNVDPRIARMEAGDGSAAKIQKIGKTDGCKRLDPDLRHLDKLEKAVPLRGIVGSVRNIADFGVFVDFGGESDGMVHTSNLGRVPMNSLLVGQQIGVDILQVENERVALALHGLNAEHKPSRQKGGGRKKAPATKKRAAKTVVKKASGTRKPTLKSASRSASKPRPRASAKTQSSSTSKPKRGGSSARKAPAKKSRPASSSASAATSKKTRTRK